MRSTVQRVDVLEALAFSATNSEAGRLVALTPGQFVYSFGAACNMLSSGAPRRDFSAARSDRSIVDTQFF
jgi:hypothetical protein